MKSSRDFDLLVRGRRRDLSVTEAKELRALLGRADDARCLFEAGIALDVESAVQPDDDALIQRLAASAAKPGSKRPGQRRLRRYAPGVMVAMLTLITAAAAAAAIVFVGDERMSPLAASATGHRESVAESEPQRAPSSPPPAQPASDPAQTPAEPGPARAEPAEVLEVSTPAARPRASGKGETAPGIFARASRARREGRYLQAKSSYERLLKRFPESVEADQARMTLAELNLRNDTPEVALKQFRESAKGTLEPDSLWGQAQALRRLERANEERRVLLRLVRMFPDSPYTGAAMLRLHDLPN